MARKEAVMALYADIETQKQAKTVMQTKSSDLSGKDHTEVATSFAEMTRQSIENRQVSGLSKLFSKKVTHPISGQKIYVIAYGISARAAASALQLEYSTFDSAASVNRANEKSKAYKTGLNNAVEESKHEVKAETIILNGKEVVKKKVFQEKTIKSKSSSKSVLNLPSIDEDDF